MDFQLPIPLRGAMWRCHAIPLRGAMWLRRAIRLRGAMRLSRAITLRGLTMQGNNIYFFKVMINKNQDVY
jgi:hypothetical protein